MSASVGEGFQQAFVAGQVRHDAQLDLRVIGGDDDAAGFGDERLANLAALGAAHRDVLQIRVVGRQPPGHRHGLRVSRVDAAGARIDHAGQLVGVGRFQLGQAAVVEDQLRQRMIQREFLQGVFIGRRRAARRLFLRFQAELVEQNLAQLLRRVQVERLAGGLMRLAFQFHHLQRQRAGMRAQQVGVELYAGAFDAAQDRQQRHFDIAVNRLQMRRRDQGRVHVQVQAQRDVRVFGGVGAGTFDIDLIETDLAGALAAHFLVFDRRLAQMPRRQRVHVVAFVRLQHIALQQRVVRDAVQIDAVVHQHMPVVFQVLADLGLAGVFQQRLQPGEGCCERQLRRRAGIVMRQRQVGRFARADRKRHADQLRRASDRGWWFRCRGRSARRRRVCPASGSGRLRRGSFRSGARSGLTESATAGLSAIAASTVLPGLSKGCPSTSSGRTVP